MFLAEAVYITSSTSRKWVIPTCTCGVFLMRHQAAMMQIKHCWVYHTLRGLPVNIKSIRNQTLSWIDEVCSSWGDPKCFHLLYLVKILPFHWVLLGGSSDDWPEFWNFVMSYIASLLLGGVLVRRVQILLPPLQVPTRAGLFWRQAGGAGWGQVLCQLWVPPSKSLPLSACLHVISLLCSDLLNFVVTYLTL